LRPLLETRGCCKLIIAAPVLRAAHKGGLRWRMAVIRYARQHGTKRLWLARLMDRRPLARIKAAVDRRNFLIHEYWRDAGYKFATEEGRAEMIAELSADTDTFEKLANDLREATRPTRQKLGIKDEALDERVERRMADIRNGMELE
jgi:hypothetical protein